MKLKRHKERKKERKKDATGLYILKEWQKKERSKK